MSDGFLLVYKPRGITSFDVVKDVRKLTGVKKVGHAGTLDPAAEGLLILGIGRQATKKLDKYLLAPKSYEAEVDLSKTSDTYDLEGKVIDVNVGGVKSKQEIVSALSKFKGEIEQMPPAYSAKKISGIPAYKLARQGIEPELKPKKVTIYELEVTHFKWPSVRFMATVSSGTYIRAIARDLGGVLGTGGILTRLVRVSQGSFSAADALTYDELSPKNIEDALVKI